MCLWKTCHSKICPALPSLIPSPHVFTEILEFLRSSQFNHSVVSDSLWPHGLYHTRPPCPSPIPGVYSNLSIESVMATNHLILCCPLLVLPSIFPRIKVFSNESVLHIRWPKYWSFRFSISPSNEYSGLISFRTEGAVSISNISLLDHWALWQLVSLLFIHYGFLCLYLLPQTLQSFPLREQSIFSHPLTLDLVMLFALNNGMTEKWAQA